MEQLLGECAPVSRLEGETRRHPVSSHQDAREQVLRSGRKVKGLGFSQGCREGIKQTFFEPPHLADRIMTEARLLQEVTNSGEVTPDPVVANGFAVMAHGDVNSISWPIEPISQEISADRSLRLGSRD
jgi:hypothetical protein